MAKRKCPKETRNPTRNYGAAFELALLKAKQYVIKKDQNYTILVAGLTGGGKSTIDLHMWDVLEGEVDFERWGFTVKTSAKAYDKARKKKTPATLFTIDELKLYARKSMAEYNTDFLDLLFSIRGQNLIMACNAPSPRSIDKIFIEEGLIDALIFIHRSQARMLWITYDRLMDLMKDQGNLKFDTLKTHGEYYAEFDTYFSPIKQEVWKEYQEYKRDSMETVGDKFVEKYGRGERYTMSKIAQMLNRTRKTITKYAEQALKEKAIPIEGLKTGEKWAVAEDYIDELSLYVEEQIRKGKGRR